MVRLPRYLPIELSSALGTIIAKRLPTNEASYWQKAQAIWNEYLSRQTPKSRTSHRNQQSLQAVPDSPWPIKAVLFVYPRKNTYGLGELILWELKLFGESADHGFFLEVILPALEEAGYTSDPQWNRPNSLWGRFDIYSVYAARGTHWEPIVSEGRLDLRYRANSTQWAEGLNFKSESEGFEVLEQSPDGSKFSKPTRLIWLAPFDFGINFKPNTKRKSAKAPNLRNILDGLASRVNLLLPGTDNILHAENQPSLQKAINNADNVPILHTNIKRAKKGLPELWMGTQIFSYIPSSLIPYLELASILHIGKHTHFGCGTFALIRSTSDLEG